MNDLKELVGSPTEPDGDARSAAHARTDIAALRTLVGVSDAAPAGARVTSESSQLRALVGEGAPVSPSSPALSADTRSALSALVGGPRSESRPDSRAALSALVGDPPPMSRPSHPDSRAALSTLVGAVGTSAEDAEWQAPDLAQVGARPLFGGRRRAGAVNYLSVAAAVLAVVVMIGTVSFAVVQRATANPADDAMVSLHEREAELANDTKVLQTAVDLYDASLTEAASLAQASEPAFAALEGRVDGSALAVAKAARETLVQASATAVPVSVPGYERASIDEKSLADVGKALDAVRRARESLPSLIAEAREARSEITTAVSAFRAELTALGSAIVAEAEKLVTQNDSAAESFRAAVTDAAGRVTAAQEAGGTGLAEMPAYAAAVDALRAENERVLVDEAAEQDLTPTQPSTRNLGTSGSNSGGGSYTPAPSPSPSESTPPAEATDPPTDTPTDPPAEEQSPPPVVIEPPVTDDTSGANP